jgi:hypothetical protein
VSVSGAEGTVAGPSGGVEASAPGVAGAGVFEASTIRRAIACVWITRSRSAATASATAARCSAAASFARRASSSPVRVSEGASDDGGSVTLSMRPRVIKAVTGICHPLAVSAAPSSLSSPRFLRSVETETPQADAASARPIRGTPDGGVVTPFTEESGGFTLEGAVIAPTVSASAGLCGPAVHATPVKCESPRDGRPWGYRLDCYVQLNQAYSNLAG